MTDEQAQEIFANEHCNISKELAGILARAIEAAVLLELDVLREYTGQNGMREWNDVGAWLRPGECIAELERKLDVAREALKETTEVLEILRRGHGVDVGSKCYPAINIAREALAQIGGYDAR